MNRTVMTTADMDRLRQVKRDGNERRELNALVHMVRHGRMVMDLSRGGNRGAGVARNAGGYAWVSTLHRLEKKRQVERLKNLIWVATETGEARGVAEIIRRREPLPIKEPGQ